MVLDNNAGTELYSRYFVYEIMRVLDDVGTVVNRGIKGREIFQLRAIIVC